MKKLFLLLLCFLFTKNIFGQHKAGLVDSKTLFENFKDISSFDNKKYDEFLLYAEEQLSGCYEHLEDEGKYTVVVCKDKKKYKIEIIHNQKALKKELRFDNEGNKEMENYYMYNIPIFVSNTYDKKGNLKTIIDNEKNMTYKVIDFIAKFEEFSNSDHVATNILDKSIYNVIMGTENTLYINSRIERKPYAIFNYQTGVITKL